MKIELRNICFSYNKKTPLIDSFDYVFKGGKCYLLRGKNGSGKTTLSKLILGLLTPKSGDIVINNEITRKKSVAEISKDIGYLFQNAELQLFAPTVWEELSFPYELNNALDEKAKEKIDKTLEQFGLSHLKTAFPLLLSGGEKQRLALATIFIRDIKFLILDEPSSSIDKEGKLFLAELIRHFIQQGGGVLVISHDEEVSAMLPDAEIILLGEAP
jgi:energy-coupling factor transport system ATP-binding protein